MTASSLTDDKKTGDKKHREKIRSIDTARAVKISVGAFLSLFIVICSIYIIVVSTQNVAWHKDIDPVFYIENGNLMCADLSKPGKIPLTVTTAIGSDDSLDSFCLSDDSKQLIFTTGHRETDDYYTVAYDLMCFNLEFPEKEPVLLAEAVTSYSVNSGFDTLTYVRTDEGVSSLYQSDFLGNEELVCEAFGEYTVCLKSNQVLYSDRNNSLFLKAYGKTPSLLCKSSVLVCAEEDFSSFILCSENGRLFRKDADGSEVLISDKADYKSYSKGDFPEFSEGKGFYITVSQSFSLTDFVIDDMLSADRKMLYTDAGYEAKLMRDAVRSTLKQSEQTRLSFNLNDIYYYDGEKSYPVAENAAIFLNGVEADSGKKKNDLLLYTRLDSVESLKVRMSELDEESAYLLNMGELTKIRNSNCEIFLAYKNTCNKKLNADPYRVEKCSYEGASGSIFISVQKSRDLSDSTDTCHIYKCTVTDSSVSELTVFEKNIYEGAVYPLADGTRAYLRADTDEDTREQSLSLYRDGTKLSEKMSTEICYDKKSKTLLACSLPDENGAVTYTLLKNGEVLTFSASDEATPWLTESGSLLAHTSDSLYRMKKKALVSWKSDCSEPVFPLQSTELSVGSGEAFFFIDE